MARKKMKRVLLPLVALPKSMPSSLTPEGEGEAAAFDAAHVREGHAVFHGGAEDGFAPQGFLDELLAVIDKAFAGNFHADFADGVVLGGGGEAGDHEGMGGEARDADFAGGGAALGLGDGAHAGFG